MAAVNPTAERYPAYECYKNLEKLLEYRNASTEYKFMTKATFEKEFSHYEMLTIKATRNDKHGKRNFYIFLTSPESKYATKLPEFKKMMRAIPEKEFDDNLEVLIISEQPLTNFITREIASRRTEHPKLYIEHHDYSKFSIVIPEHPSVPRHTIMDQKELDELLTSYHRQKENLQRIFSHDTPIVWLGARPGDVVKIERISETVGVSEGYRVVIP